LNRQDAKAAKKKQYLNRRDAERSENNNRTAKIAKIAKHAKKDNCGMPELNNPSVFTHS
jgi:hypothetical protein